MQYNGVMGEFLRLEGGQKMSSFVDQMEIFQIRLINKGCLKLIMKLLENNKNFQGFVHK